MSKLTSVQWLSSEWQKQLAPLLRPHSIPDAISLEMPALMTRLAESNTVINFKPKFWKLRKWFDVMSVQISATTIAAISACVFVARENRQSPFSIFNRAANSNIDRRLTSLPIRASRTFQFFRSTSLAHLSLARFSMRNAANRERGAAKLARSKARQENRCLGAKNLAPDDFE